jgi:uncharacterized membrane protein YfcA
MTNPQDSAVPGNAPPPAPVVRVRNKHKKLKKRRGTVRNRLRIPKTGSGQFLFFFFVEFLSCLVLVMATRAEAQANFLWTTISSFIWELQVFVTWLLMYEDKNARTWYSGAGMILGSTLGADFALWLSIHLYGR